MSSDYAAGQQQPYNPELCDARLWGEKYSVEELKALLAKAKKKEAEKYSVEELEALLAKAKKKAAKKAEEKEAAACIMELAALLVKEEKKAGDAIRMFDELQVKFNLLEERVRKVLEYLDVVCPPKRVRKVLEYLDGVCPPNEKEDEEEEDFEYKEDEEEYEDIVVDGIEYIRVDNTVIRVDGWTFAGIWDPETESIEFDDEEDE
jgi:hypothetical protein